MLPLCVLITNQHITHVVYLSYATYSFVYMHNLLVSVLLFCQGCSKLDLFDPDFFLKDMNFTQKKEDSVFSFSYPYSLAIFIYTNTCQ